MLQTFIDIPTPINYILWAFTPYRVFPVRQQKHDREAPLRLHNEKLGSDVTRLKNRVGRFAKDSQKERGDLGHTVQIDKVWKSSCLEIGSRLIWLVLLHFGIRAIWSPKAEPLFSCVCSLDHVMNGRSVWWIETRQFYRPNLVAPQFWLSLKEKRFFSSLQG